MATQSFTSAGATNWVAPANVVAVQVELWGGGGNGWTAGEAAAGGGGAYSKKNTVAVTPGNSYTVYVGGVAGDSYFINTSTALAKGGSNAPSRTGAGAGGAAASGVGDTKYSGGSGGPGGGGATGTSAAGGGAAGPHGDGGAGESYSGSNSNAAKTGGAGDAGYGGAGGGSGNNPGGASALGGGGGAGGFNNSGGGAGGWVGGGGGGGEAGAGAGTAGQVILTWTPLVLATVSTQATTSILSNSGTQNGTVTVSDSATPTERGFVYSTTSHALPGNVAPASSGYALLINETGSFANGAFSLSATSLSARTTYYVRCYAKNSVGYAYGGEVNFTTPGFTNPGNIYADDASYTTAPATDGIVSVAISKDGGVNFSAVLSKTFTATEGEQTYGVGADEMWGMAMTRADMVNSLFFIKVSSGTIDQVYSGFGFTTGTQVLSGIEIVIKAKYTASTISLNNLKVKIHYGTSTLPVQAGSQVFASNGRKAGEGAGAGTGLLVYYDGNAWIASDTGATVLA